MAARKNAGLTVGQSLTLAFGFLLGSVIIFAFGVWVGRDLAQQRQRQERPVVFQPVDKPAAPGKSPQATPVVGVQPSGDEPDRRPTRPRLTPAVSEPTPSAAPSRSPTQRLAATGTPAAIPPTMASQPRQPAAPLNGAVWTVQVTATNDQVQALVTARGLRAKGYDAFTVQADIGGAKWYRIQVGKFTDQKEAEQTAAKLRQDGREAAFVDRLR
jgi:cell division septation protein DedD